MGRATLINVNVNVSVRVRVSAGAVIALLALVHAARASDAPDAVVDVNRASREALADLPWVGDLLAAEIVRERATGGPFASLEDLARVPGVDDDLLHAIAPYARVGGERGDAATLRAGAQWSIAPRRDPGTEWRTIALLLRRPDAALRATWDGAGRPRGLVASGGARDLRVDAVVGARALHARSLALLRSPVDGATVRYTGTGDARVTLRAGGVRVWCDGSRTGPGAFGGDVRVGGVMLAVADTGSGLLVAAEAARAVRAYGGDVAIGLRVGEGRTRVIASCASGLPERACSIRWTAAADVRSRDPSVALSTLEIARNACRARVSVRTSRGDDVHVTWAVSAPVSAAGIRWGALLQQDDALDALGPPDRTWRANVTAQAGPARGLRAGAAVSRATDGRWRAGAGWCAPIGPGGASALCVAARVAESARVAAPVPAVLDPIQDLRPGGSGIDLAWWTSTTGDHALSVSAICTVQPEGTIALRARLALERRVL